MTLIEEFDIDVEFHVELCAEFRADIHTSNNKHQATKLKQLAVWGRWALAFLRQALVVLHLIMGICRDMFVEARPPF